MIGDFNIDGGVVGEQAHFIGVNFVLVFSRQLCSKNGAILPRAGNEDYRPGKGVKDMLAFILQTAVQSAAQYIFHTLDNKIDDFHRHIAIWVCAILAMSPARFSQWVQTILA